jgi:RimJ/RimL family protein N-acetyltransferase
MIRVEPVTLEGERVRLEPIEPRHLEPYLAAAMSAPDIFKWYPNPSPTRAQHEEFFRQFLSSQGKGERVTFATIDKRSARFAGSTTFFMIVPEHHRLEIGHTWIAPEFQRTHINTEAKLLMLTHCFEKIGCNRVELKTDSLNTRSREAMLRIGCTEEGTFRNHMVCADGRLRHSVYFSVIKPEWPAVRQRLLSLARR